MKYNQQIRVSWLSASKTVEMHLDDRVIEMTPEAALLLAQKLNSCAGFARTCASVDVLERRK